MCTSERLRVLSAPGVYALEAWPHWVRLGADSCGCSMECEQVKTHLECPQERPLWVPAVASGKAELRAGWGGLLPLPVPNPSLLSTSKEAEPWGLYIWGGGVHTYRRARVPGYLVHI